MKAFVETEKGIQTAIINYLGYKGWKVMRLNSGRIPIESNGKRRLVMLADPGTPDVMAFKSGSNGGNSGGYHYGSVDILFIEVKRPGNKPTFAQEQMMEELTKHGARCIVAHSVEELENLL